MKTATGNQGHMFYTSDTTDEDVLLCFQTPDEWLTRKQICTRVWRAKAPTMINRIERLVQEGRLEKTVDDTRLHTCWYRLAQS